MKSSPPLILTSAMLGIVLMQQVVGCIAAKPAVYETELVECNRNSTTLHDSITCENLVRMRYGRPLRDAGVDQ